MPKYDLDAIIYTSMILNCSLLLASLTSKDSHEEITDKIGGKGSGKLKQVVTDNVNDYLDPIRKRRIEFMYDRKYIRNIFEKELLKQSL